MSTITRQVVPVAREHLHIGLMLGPDHPTHAGLVIADVYEDTDATTLVFDGSAPDISVADTEQVPIDLPLNAALNLIGETMGVEGLALMASVLLASQEQTHHTLEALERSTRREARVHALALTQLYAEVHALNEEKLDSRQLSAILADVSGDYRIATQALNGGSLDAALLAE